LVSCGIGAQHNEPLDTGLVAFGAELDTPRRGIYVGSGGATTTIADDSGRFYLLGSTYSSINSSGRVAFHAEYYDPNLNDGIFVGGGGLSDFLCHGPSERVLPSSRANGVQTGSQSG
jgi:hypothetical protein